MAKKQKTLNDYVGYFEKRPDGSVRVNPKIIDYRKELGAKNFWRIVDFMSGHMSQHETAQLEIGMNDANFMRGQFESTKEATYKRLKSNRGEFCANCGAGNRLTIDHIVPLSKGGSNDDDNLQLMCLPCNQRKGTR
jgi:hypothetical protein